MTATPNHAPQPTASQSYYPVFRWLEPFNAPPSALPLAAAELCLVRPSKAHRLRWSALFSWCWSVSDYPRLSSLKERSIKFDTDPPQHLDARFRLFKTDNLWNFILPDTRLGLLYQVQYSVDNKKGSRGIFPLNDEPLVDSKDAAVHILSHQKPQQSQFSF